MKTKLLKLKKTYLIILGSILLSASSFAATYTAVASGNWSSSATWGGTPPPFTLTALDQVTIGAGLTVTMDSIVTVNGLLAQISVAGTLTSATNTLNVTTGTLTGAGSLVVNGLILNSGGTFSFTGAVNANTFTNSITSLALTAQVTVNKVLNLMNVVSVQAGGTLTMAANSIINVSGGQLAISGGTVSLSSVYDVNYITSSATAGMELSGSGLRNVTINVSSVNSVTLGSSLVVNDSLKMVSGSLVLNGNSLTINGKLSGAGTFTGDASANLVVNTTGGTAVPIHFAAGAQTIDNLTINVGSGNSVTIGSDLTVAGTLTLTGGSNINVSSTQFTLSGSYTGTGSIMVDSHSMITIDPTSSITNAISFSGASMGDLIVNPGSGNTITLGSNVIVADTLNITSGTLDLNGGNLTVMGDIAASGNGMIFSSATSNITISTPKSTSGSLTFQYPGNVVNNFNVVIGAAGSVKLGSDMVVSNALNFTTGSVDIGNYNLTIDAAGSVSGANANSYVITSGTGYFTMSATTSSTTTFAVGTSSYYFPASITLNSGSSTGTVGVNVSAGVYSQGTTGSLMSATNPMVNATWLFETNISSGLNANMQLTWSPATEVNGFIHTGDYIAHYTSGAWDTATSVTATAVAGGMFSIQRKNITSFSPFAIFDQGTTGISEVVVNNQFTIYPNPASNVVYIQNNSGLQGQINADVINILGQVVESYIITNSNSEISLSGLNPGDYFIKLYNDKSSVVKKVVKM